MTLVIQHFGTDFHGTFGEVYAALDLDHETGLSRQVAVKQLRSSANLLEIPLRPGSEATPAEVLQYCRATFERERRLATSIPPHPNLVRALRADRFAGQPLLVMEYVHGASLLELVQPDQGLSYLMAPLDVLHLLVQIGGALALLHDQMDLVHGDVNPTNILYDGADRPLLADFGFALDADAAKASGEAGGRNLLFQLLVEPPEEAAGDRPTAAGDVWRLGLCCAQAARGRPLQEHELAALKRGAEAPRLLALAEAPSDDELGVAVGDLLQRLLDPDPAGRPESGLELLRQLRAADATAEGIRILGRRSEIRSALRALIRRPPASASERLGELEEYDRELSGIRERSSPLALPLPEDFTLLAAAAWAGYRATADDRLARRAAADAARSTFAYDGDARVIDLLNAADEVVGQQNTPELIERARRQRRRLEVFGSALAANSLRGLIAALEKLGGADGAGAREEAERGRRVLARYEQAELSFLQELSPAESSPEYLFR